MGGIESSRWGRNSSGEVEKRKGKGRGKKGREWKEMRIGRKRDQVEK